jgi:hypothetical protein
MPQTPADKLLPGFVSPLQVHNSPILHSVYGPNSGTKRPVRYERFAQVRCIFGREVRCWSVLRGTADPMLADLPHPYRQASLTSLSKSSTLLGFIAASGRLSLYAPYRDESSSADCGIAVGSFQPSLLTAPACSDQLSTNYVSRAVHRRVNAAAVVAPRRKREGHCLRSVVLADTPDSGTEFLLQTAVATS